MPEKTAVQGYMALKRSHDAMMRMLMKTCERSDELVEQGIERGPEAEKQYAQAKKLIARAEELQR